MSENQSILSGKFINLLSVVFILIGVYIAWPSAKVLLSLQASHDWPQVTGKVISAQVERRWLTRGDDLGQDYFARVLFGYQVNGQRYVSDMVHFAQPWTKVRKVAEDLAGKYPAGRTVEVYYDPAAPQTGVLDNAFVPPRESVFLGIGVLLVLAGLVAFITTVFRDLFA